MTEQRKKHSKMMPILGNQGRVIGYIEQTTEFGADGQTGGIGQRHVSVEDAQRGGYIPEWSMTPVHGHKVGFGDMDMPVGMVFRCPICGEYSDQQYERCPVCKYRVDPD